MNALLVASSVRTLRVMDSIPSRCAAIDGVADGEALDA
jgi:hypothetical protein